MNKKLKIVFRLGLSCVFLGYLGFKVDWRLVVNAMMGIDLRLYALSTIVTFTASLFLALKYYIFISRTSIRRSLFFLFKVNLISRFYALFLPSAVGSMAVRWYKVTRNRESRAFFLATIAFERLTFYFILLLFCLIPLFLALDNPGFLAFWDKLLPVILAGIVIVMTSMVYFISLSARSYVNDVVSRASRFLDRNQRIVSFLNNFSIKQDETSFYLNLIALSLLWQVFFLARIWLVFKAAEIDLNFSLIAWIGSSVLLLQMLPISFAGIGLREGVYALLFTFFGLTPEGGVLIGLLLSSQILMLAALGGFFELTEKES